MKRLLLLAAIAMFAVVACGGDDPDASASENNEAVAVTATDNAFDPSDITAGAGSSIEVINEGEAPHNFSVTGSGIDVDIDPGESMSIDTSELEAGSHDVECKFHAGAGMTATLTVE